MYFITSVVNITAMVDQIKQGTGALHIFWPVAFLTQTSTNHSLAIFFFHAPTDPEGKGCCCLIPAAESLS